MKILVLGATGFIGGHIYRRLRQRKEHEVFGVGLKNIPSHNRDINLLRVDLTNKKEVDGLFNGYDAIVQSAAATSGAFDTLNDPACHVTENALLNSVVLREAARARISLFIFLSCSVMYQKQSFPRRKIPVRECDDDLEEEIHDAYHGVGWTKIYIEKMCKFYSRAYGINAHCIRHSNIYGPGDKFDSARSHVIGATIRKALMKDDSPLVAWGSGTEFRDFLYIDDLLSAIDELLYLEKFRGFNLWNVGSSTETTIRELIKIIMNLANCSERGIVFNTDLPTIKTGVLLDSSKFKQATGWAPKVSLVDGLKETIAWYRKNLTGD